VDSTKRVEEFDEETQKAIHKIMWEQREQRRTDAAKGIVRHHPAEESEA
jgi:hypothetical protein